ncbi:MAG: DUF2235 domain-containing protein [Bacteroidales bacterium]|nr:DUF2235 domain-containing protein [Bacteroidales bacterium]
MSTRNIVLAFDGTSNKPDLDDDGVNSSSNVYMFKEALKNKRSNPTRCIYEQGVGTKYGEHLLSNAFGKGLELRIQKVYRNLQNLLTDGNFEENKIFIIGFSRGAYSARRLAGLLNYSGIPENIQDWTIGWNNFILQNLEAVELKQSGAFLDVKIKMIGVWDTVKAAPQISDFHDTYLPANVEYAYHAMSIDEKRKQFQVLRWNADKRVTQLWFPGVHSNVGGGYADKGLSDIALKWMIGCACKHGLEFKPSYIDANVKPDTKGILVNSLENWKLGRITRKILQTDMLHASVKDRMESDIAYRPVNLPETPIYDDGSFV